MKKIGKFISLTYFIVAMIILVLSIFVDKMFDILVIITMPIGGFLAGVLLIFSNTLSENVDIKIIIVFFLVILLYTLTLYIIGKVIEIIYKKFFKRKPSLTQPPPTSGF